MEPKNDLLQNDLILDNASAANLKEMAMWGKFLGIVGFIYTVVIAVLSVLFGFFFQQIMPKVPMNNGAAVVAGGIVFGVVYFVMAVIIFFVSLYLFRFGIHAQAAFKANDQQRLAESFSNLKSYFRFMGVIMVISLIMTGLAVIAVLVSVAAR